MLSAYSLYLYVLPYILFTDFITQSEVLNSEIYQELLNSPSYDLTNMKDMGEIDSGSSLPHLYQNGVQKYLVKKGIGKNHEFLDGPLAGVFLNFLHKNSEISPKYPKMGYHILYDASVPNAIPDVLGIVSPWIDNFESLYDIMIKYKISRLQNSEQNKKVRPLVTVHDKNFQHGEYMKELTQLFGSLNPVQITDYFIDMFISGGADPNPTNWGFTKTKSECILTKVDIEGSFKDYKDISGDDPQLEYNAYAFDLPRNLVTFQSLFDFVKNDGYLLMPGKAYEPINKMKKAYSGQGNMGFYNGFYRTRIRGINLAEYVKLEHFIKSITRIKQIGKNAIIAKFKESAKNIYSLLNYSNQRGQIPLIKDGKEVFDKYIEGRAMFIEDRLDYLYMLSDTLNIKIENNKPSDLPDNISIERMIPGNGMFRRKKINN